MVRKGLQELVDFLDCDAVVAQQHPQARIFKSDIACCLLHFQGGLDATALIVLEFLLQPLDIFFVTSAGAALVVTNTDSGRVR